MTEKDNANKKGGFGYPVLGDGRGTVDFICPHCQDKEAWATRVQSSDELSWKTLQPDRMELWECDKCGGYNSRLCIDHNFFLCQNLWK